jgi:hypothetical protein
MDVEAILRSYFTGEKSEAFWILAAGIACLLAAAWLWLAVRQPFARGLATSLLVVAALGLGVGGSVYFRTDRQLAGLAELQRVDAPRFAAEEGPRIRQVIRSFGMYRVAYAAAVLVALVCVFALGSAYAHGLAVGLLVLAALGLTIDHYAEARAIEYVQRLEAAGALPGG